MLCISIIRRRHLHNIRRHEVHPLQPPNDRPQLPRAPTPSLGRPCRRRKRRIQRIDIDAQIHRVLGADAVLDALDDALHAAGEVVGRGVIYFAGLDDGEAAVAVVGVVGEAGEGGADAGVDVGVVGEEAFVRGVVEVSAVVDGGLVGGRAAEDGGLPGVAGEWVGSVSLRPGNEGGLSVGFVR